MCNIMILVNREHPLGPDYIPPELQEADFPFLAGSGDPKRLLCRPAALAGKELFDRCRMAVSYTHLDVYKRQPLHLPGSMP